MNEDRRYQLVLDALRMGGEMDIGDIANRTDIHHGLNVILEDLWRSNRVTRRSNSGNGEHYYSLLR